jgi:hypothetical protein
MNKRLVFKQKYELQLTNRVSFKSPGRREGAKISVPDVSIDPAIIDV